MPLPRMLDPLSHALVGDEADRSVIATVPG
jgi:hypothetical protein